MKVDEKSKFAKIFGQRVPIIIIFIIATFGFLYFKSIELAGSSFAVAILLGKDYVTSVNTQKTST